MKKLYSTAVTSNGGRNGHVTSADKVLDVDVRLPKSLGGNEGNYLNPETFFAAGFAACFNSSLMRIAQLDKIQTGNITVIAEVDIIELGNGAFGLAVKLIIDIPGVEHATAEELARKAHQICPYSNATRGNIDVELVVK